MRKPRSRMSAPARLAAAAVALLATTTATAQTAEETVAYLQQHCSSEDFWHVEGSLYAQRRDADHGTIFDLSKVDPGRNLNAYPASENAPPKIEIACASRCKAVVWDMASSREALERQYQQELAENLIGIVFVLRGGMPDKQTEKCVRAVTHLISYYTIATDEDMF